MKFAAKQIKNTPRAFTLLEVLLAIAIFAIVLAAINGIFYGALHLQINTSATIEEMMPADHAMSVIKRDVANIVLPGYMAKTVSGGLGSKTPVTAGLGLNGPVSLEIYTSGGNLNDDEPWGDVQKVDYSLQEPLERGRGKDLVRSVSRNLLATTIENPVEQRLLGNVDKLKVSFYDGASWVDSWDDTLNLTTSTSTNPPVPAAIRFEITQISDDKKAAPVPIDIIVPIMTAFPVQTNL